MVHPAILTVDSGSGCEGAEALARLGAAPHPAPAQVQLPTLPPLPALPALPALPVLPALPTVDPVALLKPVTDLLGVFGTGSFGGGAGDPAVSHRQIAESIEGGIGTLLRAARSLDGAWAGQAATSAITSAVRTAGEAGRLAAQGAAMSVDLQAAAAIVAAGATQLQGVVAKTAGLLTAAMPAIATPPGQIAALGIAAEGLAEGLAVVSATRAQLVGPTAQMAANGTPVPVSGVRGPGGDGFEVAAALLQRALPLVQAGTSLATSLLVGNGQGGEIAGGNGLDGSGSGSPAAGCPPTGPLVSGAGTGPSTCAPGCDRGGTNSAPSGPSPTGSPTSGGLSSAAVPPGGPTVSAAGIGGVGATGGVPVTAGATTVSAEPTPLADCPVTTNAAAVAEPLPEGRAVPGQSVSAGTVPIAPMAPTAVRASVDAPRTDGGAEYAEPPATSAQQVPAEPDWLATATTESLDFDVALALGLGEQNLTGSV